MKSCSFPRDIMETPAHCDAIQHSSTASTVHAIVLLEAVLLWRIELRYREKFFNIFRCSAVLETNFFVV